ncbi:MAG: hypothetical protein LBG05_10380 [Treponema sp.]|nr:hypothetical protein [Treponema sp.]
MKKTFLLLLTIMLSFSMALVSCGGDDDDDMPKAVKVSFGGAAASVDPVVLDKDAVLGLKLPFAGVEPSSWGSRDVAPVIAIPDGKQFKEWNTKEDGSGTAIGGDTKISSNTTIYPIFEDAYVETDMTYAEAIELVYNPYGGKDADGIYNYQLIVPVTNLGADTGKILTGHTWTLEVDGKADHAATVRVYLSEWNSAYTTLSNQIDYRNVAKGVVFTQADGIDAQTEDADEGSAPSVTSFVTTVDSGSSIAANNVLVVQAVAPYLTEKITLYLKTFTLTPDAEAIEPPPVIEGGVEGAVYLITADPTPVDIEATLDYGNYNTQMFPFTAAPDSGFEAGDRLVVYAEFDFGADPGWIQAQHDLEWPSFGGQSGAVGEYVFSTTWDVVTAGSITQMKFYWQNEVTATIKNLTVALVKAADIDTVWPTVYTHEGTSLTLTQREGQASQYVISLSGLNANDAFAVGDGIIIDITGVVGDLTGYLQFLAQGNWDSWGWNSSGYDGEGITATDFHLEAIVTDEVAVGALNGFVGFQVREEETPTTDLTITSFTIKKSPKF